MVIREGLAIEGDGGGRFRSVEQDDGGGIADPFDREGELFAGLVSGKGFAGGREHVGFVASGRVEVEEEGA